MAKGGSLFNWGTKGKNGGFVSVDAVDEQEFNEEYLRLSGKREAGVYDDVPADILESEEDRAFRIAQDETHLPYEGKAMPFPKINVEIVYDLEGTRTARELNMMPILVFGGVAVCDPLNLCDPTEEKQL